MDFCGPLTPKRDYCDLHDPVSWAFPAFPDLSEPSKLRAVGYHVRVTDLVARFSRLFRFLVPSDKMSSSDEWTIRCHL